MTILGSEDDRSVIDDYLEEFELRTIVFFQDPEVTHFFFFSSRRRHTSWPRDWSSDVCSSDLSTGRRAPYPWFSGALGRNTVQSDWRRDATGAVGMARVVDDGLQQYGRRALCRTLF